VGAGNVPEGPFGARFTAFVGGSFGRCQCAAGGGGNLEADAGAHDGAAAAVGEPHDDRFGERRADASALVVAIDDVERRRLAVSR
jgi:hypothetical protein